MSLLCGALNKGSAWETRSQGCIISFLGLGQETRKGEEGILIRSRKQHQELAFSPTVRCTQPSKTRTETLLKPLHFPRHHFPRATQCIRRLRRSLQSKLVSSFPSSPNPTLEADSQPVEDSQPVCSTKPRGWTQPRKSLPSPTPNAPTLLGLSSSFKVVPTPQVLPLL